MMLCDSCDASYPCFGSKGNCVKDVSRGWIGVDLDGTLAHYDGWKAPHIIGDPILPMLERVKRWLHEGRTVKIFTARAEIPEQIQYVEIWCVRHIGIKLEVTNKKDLKMIELWDDRCVRVQANTGQPCCEFWRHIS